MEALGATAKAKMKNGMRAGNTQFAFRIALHRKIYGSIIIIN